jgi:hypothetical protein
MADKFRVQAVGNGKFRVWNETKGKWADRVLYDTRAEAQREVDKKNA